MKYLVIGAGGTGGSIAGFMSQAGFDVSIIARGEHLRVIQHNGLRLETTRKGHYTIYPKACTMEDYHEQPDVIFNCVKGYALAETIPFIKRICHKNTVIIPILNIYGTGGLLQQQLPNVLVTDGCIYIAAEIKAPGVILQTGDIFRVVFGVRKPNEYLSILKEIENDLNTSGIRGILSDNIQRDALQKFSFVSPMAGCGVYYDCEAGAMQKHEKERTLFIALIQEIEMLAQAMGIVFQENIVEKNLAILDALSPAASTSMQRDLRQGKQTEMDGLLFEVVRLAKRYAISLPYYEMICKKFK